MNIDDFGMDTITRAGPLQAKRRAVKEGGFGQIMLAARDIVGHPAGIEAAVAAVKGSGLRVTGLQILRDFEGLTAHLHDYKVDMAKSMIEMCNALGCRLLLACSSTSQHAACKLEVVVRDLRKLAMLALPHSIRVAHEGLSRGRHINEYTTAWAAVEAADCPNPGLCVDSYHVFATNTPREPLEGIDPYKVLFVQLADVMWSQVRPPEERMNVARTFRVFPGGGVHNARMVELVRALDRLGYRGDSSFEVFNDGYQQLPLPTVVARAQRAAVWLAEGILRHSTTLPGQMQLRR
jgi:sugar phosphate isomerase/epimerase